MNWSFTRSWRTFAAAGAASLVLLGGVVGWRASRALRSATEEVRSEAEIRFIARPLPEQQEQIFDPISAPAVFVQAARFHDGLYVAGPAGLTQYDAGGKWLKHYAVGRDLPSSPLVAIAPALLADSQEPDGRWRAVEVQLRPPITESDVAATARTIQALQGYSIPARRQEFAKRIARGLAWLKQTKPVRAEDSSMRLSGLTWGGASEGDLKSAANGLLSLQRPDGGWGNNPYMDSDAYATGGALVALAESGVVNVNGSAYQRGVKYLLSTQFPDGSWHVRSRAIKFQPYFESGFPFGHDQWISTAATAWASQAIALPPFSQNSNDEVCFGSGQAHPGQSKPCG